MRTLLFYLKGRQNEINELSGVLKSLEAGKRTTTNIIVIEGEAGIGKTRLLEEFMDMVEANQFRFAVAFHALLHFFAPIF